MGGKLGRLDGWIDGMDSDSDRSWLCGAMSRDWIEDLEISVATLILTNIDMYTGEPENIIPNIAIKRIRIESNSNSKQQHRQQQQQQLLLLQ